MDKIKYICELCKKQLTMQQISWSGSFILCNSCNKYLKKKYRREFKEE